MHEQSGEVKPAVSHGDKNFTRAIKIGASYEDGFRNFLFRNRRLISIESKIISLYDVILQLPWNVKETSKMYNYLLEDRITRKVFLSIQRTNRRKILFKGWNFFRIAFDNWTAYLSSQPSKLSKPFHQFPRKFSTDRRDRIDQFRVIWSRLPRHKQSIINVVIYTIP